MAGVAWDPTFPVPIECGIYSVDHTVGAPNPFDIVRAVYWRNHQWRLVMHFNNAPYADAMRLAGFLSQGMGGIRTFQVPFFHYRKRIGTKSGTVTLSGTHSAGDSSLAVTGGSGLFAAGDYLYINQGSGVPRAYLVFDDEVGGVVDVHPPLRAQAAAGSNIHSANVAASTLGAPVIDYMELPDEFELPTVAVNQSNPVYALPFTVEFVSALRRVP